VLTETPTEQTITEGEKATFQCTASGNPAPKIKWVKDDSIVGAGETLTFDAVRDNSGEYWCVAENGFSDTANASAYLDVQCKYEFVVILICQEDYFFCLRTVMLNSKSLDKILYYIFITYLNNIHLAVLLGSIFQAV